MYVIIAYICSKNNRMKNLSIGKKIKGWEFVTDKIFDPSQPDLINGEKLPYEDASVDNIYINHTLEYLYDTSILSLLRECYRVLKRRGLLRIAAVNITLYHHAYMRGDKDMLCELPEHFFKLEKSTWKLPIEELLLYAFASQLSAVYGGDGFLVKMEDGSEYNALNSLMDAVGQNECYNLILRNNINIERHRTMPGFINWISIGKIHEFLLREINPDLHKGFPLVYISSYGQSSYPGMRDIKNFDCDFPQGSLYIEAMR